VASFDSAAAIGVRPASLSPHLRTLLRQNLKRPFFLCQVGIVQHFPPLRRFTLPPQRRFFSI